MDDLDPAHLGITEEIVVPVAEDQDIQAPGLEVLEFIELESPTAVDRLIGKMNQKR